MNRHMQARRPLATISVCGVSHLAKRNPYIVAWWSVIYPGFGHYLLNQYLRGTLFTLSEVVFNSLSHVNEAIVFSFCGQFAMAKSILQIRWLYGYLGVFFYCIWSSYHSAIVQNKMTELAEMEDQALPNNLLHPLEIQYLERKSPYTAAIYSFFVPGLGQVYNHRFILAFYGMLWWWIFVTFSHVYESVFYFLMGDLTRALAVLDPHWFLFMPSVMGGSICHAFIMGVEHNRLFKLEQKQYLAQHYQSPEISIFP
jgi:hypothetical protein